MNDLRSFPCRLQGQDALLNAAVLHRHSTVLAQVFRDMEQPERFVEHFVTETWAEHLRQHGRVTVADRDVQERILTLQAGSERPKVIHYLAGYASPEAVGAKSKHPVPPGPVDWQG